MSADDWELVKRAFDAALAVAPALRTQIIDEICAHRPEVREMARTLIDAHLSAGSTEDLISIKPPSPNVLRDGELVNGRFRILRLLGRGGMGEVYEAHDERLRTLVALKTLRAEYLKDTDARLRFEREIRVAREVTHKGLCRIYDLQEHRDARTR